MTGTRVPASNFARQNEADEFENEKKSASRSAMTDPYGAFLSRLQAGLRANDRQAIEGLIGFPLRVNVKAAPKPIARRKRSNATSTGFSRLE